MNAEVYERLNAGRLIILVSILPVALRGWIRNNDCSVRRHAHPWRMTWLGINIPAH